ncbi:hypothetical protein AGR6A_Cc40023 [Agrobacterium sp. NCPPB 925]|nr:hypothetical protein AGR6A_Cc40023 [Agrobacterium sp. NCPPB 925]
MSERALPLKFVATAKDRATLAKY